MMKQEVLIVFDFDGTIANSIYTFEDIYNKISKQFGLKALSAKDLNNLRNSKPEQILQALNLSGFSLLKLPFILQSARAELTGKMDSIKPIEGMVEVIKSLKKKGFKLGIISSNSVKNIKKFLKNYNLEEFDFIMTTGIFGKAKTIRRVIELENKTRNQVIYVGDEIRDVRAAQKENIRVVSVSWGFNSKEILSKEMPSFLIDKPEELIKISNQF